MAKPLSIQEYGTRLSGAVAPVETALKGLEKAKGYKGLADRVDAVQQSGGQAATALRALTPPPAIAAEHNGLVSALWRSRGELGDTGERIGDQGLCTGKAVRAEVGDQQSTTALRTALDAVKAKLPGADLSLTLPSAGQKIGSRPGNGKFIRSGSRGGRGTLSIDNGTSEDAVVTLRKGSRTAFSVYVREGKKYTVTGITDGDYTVYFTSGSGWDDKARAFGGDCAFQRFEEELDYSTTRTATQIRWRTWRISLHSTPDGKARTSEVDPAEFPES